MRLLHTMLRVGDLQRSIDFYTKVLGMKLTTGKGRNRRTVYPGLVNPLAYYLGTT